MRLHFVSVLGLISVAFANAGEIQLGGVNGLTYNYITQQSGAVCAAGTGNCFAGSTGGNESAPGVGTTGFVEKNYDVRLFQGATENSNPETPYTGYNQTAGSPGTLGEFSMINDGTGSPINSVSNSNNYWNALTSSTITVPVGISSVGDVAIMLNNVWGTAGSSSDTQVTFNYSGVSASSSVFNDTVIVNLQNAPSGTSGSPGGQISASIDCASSECTFANQAPASSSVASGVTIDDTTLFSSLYNAVTTGSAYQNSNGSVNLDGLDFLLGSVVAPSSSEYLVNIQVTEMVGTAGVSQTALSAITVGTVPEPSTVMLFLSGLGALGIARFRRKS